MTEQKITIQDAQKSISEFKYLTNHLRFENTEKFQSHLHDFIIYTKTDPFFKLVHKKILTQENHDFDVWFKSQDPAKQRDIGLKFPPAYEDREPLVYMFLQKINDKQISLEDIFYCYFEKNYQSLLDFELNVLFDFYRKTRAKLQMTLKKMNDIASPQSSNNKPTSEPSIIINQHNASGAIGQISTGDNNNLQAQIKKNNDELLKLFEELKKKISDSDISSVEKEDHLTTVEICQDFLTADKPRVTQAKFLLNSLPPIADVATIISAITTLATSIPM